uniref:EH domain binding protein 1 n=1 Tax=Vombatus ursinus TaxID=29139 RepID=A0A4X2L9P0_VOMUR
MKQYASPMPTQTDVKLKFKPLSKKVVSATLQFSLSCIFLREGKATSLVGKDVVVELKNDLSICGTLHSVDEYLNIKLTDISVTDPEKYLHMLSVKNCFITTAHLATTECSLEGGYAAETVVIVTTACVTFTTPSQPSPPVPQLKILVLK